MLKSIIGAAGGLIGAKVGFDMLNRRVNAKDNDEYKWDYNWDRRHPQENWTDDEKAKFTPKQTRWVYMIRHGQYEDGAKDKDRCLSEKGREQARLCGEYLKKYVFAESKPTQFVHSTMLRATETAQIINEVLQVECPVESCDLIREGAPVAPEPPLKGWPEKPWNEYKDGPRIEAGFRRYIRRAKPESTSTERAVVVCHGNVIRYYLCRGLQLPPTAWLHMTLPHCSVSQLHCRASGSVGTRGIGETGFLPPHLVTVSNERKN